MPAITAQLCPFSVVFFFPTIFSGSIPKASENTGFINTLRQSASATVFELNSSGKEVMIIAMPQTRSDRSIPSVYKAYFFIR